MKVLAFVAALLPLLRLVVLGSIDALGANPIEVVTRSTGTWTMVLLWIALAITPVRHFTGWHQLVDLRRMAGLFAAFYGLLHLMTYVWFDQFFDWMAIGRDILKRPFITVGVAALVLMVPLAVTSTDRWQRRMGTRDWLRLHRLAYPAALLAALHFVWLVKRDLTEPLIYAGILGLLLASRVPIVLRRRARRVRVVRR
jgi:sulfoxide reductase heme-binding subunit YedZ